MYKIDKIDKNIVDLVMEDGRMSCAEIARRIGGVTERIVRYRLERLIEEGVITISAIVNPKVLGFPVYADVWIEVEAEKIQEVAQKMTEYDCISYVACSIGESDVSVQVIARDTQEVYRFVTGVIGKTPGVRKTTSSIVPLVMKDVYDWRIPEGACDELPEESKK